MFTLAGASGARYSIVVHLPSVLLLQISANEWETIDDLRRAGSAGATLACETIPPALLAPKSGYRRGCNAPGTLWAVPIDPYRTGVRGFATLAEGRVCYTSDGTVPNPETCKPLP